MMQTDNMFLPKRRFDRRGALLRTAAWIAAWGLNLGFFIFVLYLAFVKAQTIAAIIAGPMLFLNFVRFFGGWIRWEWMGVGRWEPPSYWKKSLRKSHG